MRKFYFCKNKKQKKNNKKKKQQKKKQQNICCGYSLKVRQGSTFNEYPQHVFVQKKKEKYLSNYLSNLELCLH